ncbi:hypothetical protein GGP41_010515 [Bipolaris sorokiniana]|uniref:Uncharacterized protein n=1 Tax=Cochliobolus sativus TaxID=45130 RepID=A0A8H5ZKP2_COCSA|nr:hypothetical protein GGP41_010515 [Bipolaris sorokiniana]
MAGSGRPRARARLVHGVASPRPWVTVPCRLASGDETTLPCNARQRSASIAVGRFLEVCTSAWARHLPCHVSVRANSLCVVECASSVCECV